MRQTLRFLMRNGPDMILWGKYFQTSRDDKVVSDRGAGTD